MERTIYMTYSQGDYILLHVVHKITAQGAIITNFSTPHLRKQKQKEYTKPHKNTAKQTAQSHQGIKI